MAWRLLKLVPESYVPPLPQPFSSHNGYRRGVLGRCSTPPLPTGPAPLVGLLFFCTHPQNLANRGQSFWRRGCDAAAMPTSVSIECSRSGVRSEAQQNFASLSESH
ncbi:hypothetical protein AVEN_146980-1 [Araneus ventricosus]|uniref:Uncharacterized protein n=1 Tax=Araneus ventricosus TaxID=182803 RepID=A0A4Y2NAJ5_ARAVE|nr:hypothetical protein AVEN_146980-1 [Araneus ventricosus]